MIPIRLDWQRPLDGVEVVPLTLSARVRDYAPPDYEHQHRIARARTRRFEPVHYTIVNLENPIAIQLVNCRNDDDFVKFMSRFGFLSGGWNDALFERSDPSSSQSASMSEAYALKNTVDRILEISDLPADRERIGSVNKLLSEVKLVPELEYLNGKNRLLVCADALSDLIMMEAVHAYEQGAVRAHCGHCERAYLTGPLTGRRSTAVYCSDRCRMAAMRERNASGGKNVRP